MNRIIRVSAWAAGILAAAASTVLLAAALAGASSVPPMNKAYAVYGTGQVRIPPAGEALYSGGSPVILPNADAAGLLHTGVIADRAGPASASASLPALMVTLPGGGALRARAVSSSCRYNTQTAAVTGGATITGGTISWGHRRILLPPFAPPNTRIVVRRTAVITLNRQFTGPRGTLTVAALRIRMLRGHQRLLLATSVCAAAPRPRPPR